MLRRIAVVAVCLALGACGHQGAAPGTGVRGTVTIGPQCPVQQLASPCPDLPFQGEVRATAMDGAQTTVATDVHGRFTMDLAAGTYLVAALTASGGMPRAVPATVEVRESAYTAVTLEVDTGIR